MPSEECTSDIIFESENVSVVHTKIEGSTKSVVTFSPRLGALRAGPADPRGGFGREFFVKSGISAFHVMPKWNHWWQHPDMERVLDVIRRALTGDQALWTYGASMGGTGALMFADRLNADGAISLCPQATVDLKRAAFDPRWMEDRRRIEYLDDSWLARGIRTPAWILYDPGFVLDDRHAEIIREASTGFHAVPVRFGDHSVARMLLECGQLSSTIRSLMDGSFDLPGVLQALRAKRAQSPVALIGASNILSRRKSWRRAVAFSQKATSLLREQKDKGEVLDQATTILAVYVHTANLVRARDTEMASAFARELETDPLVRSDFDWQLAQMALVTRNSAAIMKIMESRFVGKGISAQWIDLLTKIIKSGMLSGEQIATLHARWGSEILAADKTGSYAGEISRRGSDLNHAKQNRLLPALIVGPSHVVRWQWHVRDKVVRCGLPHERIIGLGGAPIWSKTLLERAKIIAGTEVNIAVIVPDFRFGNGICIHREMDNKAVMQDGFLAIDVKALSAENDRAMLVRCLAALRMWSETFPARACYIFWCLFCRQIQDRLAGRYISAGRYRHPVFNYDEIVASLPGLDIIDLSPLFQMPMHEVRRLFIDSSSHPSQIGYLLLNALICEGRGVLQAYQQAVDEVEEALFALARKLAEAHGGPVLLTGRSIWLDTLSVYLGATGVERLAQAGLLLAPLNPMQGRPPVRDLAKLGSFMQCATIVVSAGGRDLTSALANAFGTTMQTWQDVPVIDWESATTQVIGDRGETPSFRHLATGGPPRAEAARPVVRSDMVEQGPFGMPSWTGIRHLLEYMGSDKVPTVRPLSKSEQIFTEDDSNQQTPRQTADYRIEGEALLTQDNIAFLIGGNHSVMKFITGESVASSASKQAFNDNIAARLQLAQSQGLPYLHVVFPDKQSVISEAFPIQPVHRLGDAYMAHLEPALRPHVLYPADALKRQDDPPYLPLDTHMTDHGSLAVLRMMLDAAGLEADAELERLSSHIVKPLRWPGDLGSKFTPPLQQDGLLLDADWESAMFCSPGGFNDGLIDILITPDAALDKVVLLFGDSFFRMMLKHLSRVFTRVICLRTRFMHPEMVTLIRPDIIFTGNAERYLSHVTADTEAQAFSLYPQLRGSDELAMPKDFLEAWAAVTAPSSSRSRAFMARYGLPRQVSGRA